MLNSTALRVARARLGITQTELSKRIGITQTHYNRIEHGKRGVSLKTLGDICGVLGIKVADVLE